MTEVKLSSPSDLDKSLRLLKKKLDREGIIKEIRERKTFRKKSRLSYEKRRKQKYRAKIESQNKY